MVLSLTERSNATLADGKNICYSLPRPGIVHNDDCYLDMFVDEIKRDLKIIHALGATTLFTINPTDFRHTHDVMLSELARYNISLGVTIQPDADGLTRKNLEYMQEQLTRHNVTIEVLFIDFPELDFDNAEDFFKWASQVRGWMAQFFIDCPLIIRFYPEVNNGATINALIERWDTGHFDGWGVEQYSVNGIGEWLNKILTGREKKAFFFYGSDKWDLHNKTVDYEGQVGQLEELHSYLTRSHTNSSITDYSNLLGYSLMTYSDVHHLGRAKKYFQGGKGDICPDKNPYIQSSCGGIDPNIAFGDQFFSVERMGIFDQYETLQFQRCVSPTPGAKAMLKFWSNKDNDPVIDKDTCVFSISIPGMYIYYLWGTGLAFAILGLVLGLCAASRNDRIREKKLFKRKSSMNIVLIEKASPKGKKLVKKSKKNENSTSQ